MVDVVDNVNDTLERNLSKQIAAARKQKAIPFTGKCLSCDEPIKMGRYCDKECRDDHERSMKQFR